MLADFSPSGPSLPQVKLMFLYKRKFALKFQGFDEPFICQKIIYLNLNHLKSNWVPDTQIVHFEIQFLHF